MLGATYIMYIKNVFTLFPKVSEYDQEIAQYKTADQQLREGDTHDKDSLVKTAIETGSWFNRNRFHIESLVVPIGDPRDRCFYPMLTLMIDSYVYSSVSCPKKCDRSNV